MIFIDTSYLLALVQPHDQHHQQAVDASTRCLSRRVTSEYVLVELGGALAHPRHRRLFVKLAEQLRQDVETHVVPASRVLLDRGLALFEARQDKNWSLVDCISFLIMQDHAITDALTSDHHFEQAGFKALLLQP